MKSVEVKDVSIKYLIGDFRHIGFKDYIIKKLKKTYRVEDFYANKNISFSLEKGDMLGIIGVNGAGKSTLLKVISGVMDPNEGEVITHGNIASFLELSAGFDIDLTVKENAYLRGAMLGYDEQFMNSIYKDIIEFSELEKYEDRPIKELSSGMRARLAFSIGSFVRPDIIILDEVLAVGDGAFRQKSYTKMKEILSSGATGIIVSHSLDQIKSLCNKILWLDKGEVVSFTDDIEKCLNLYNKFLKEKYKGYNINNGWKR